MATGVTALETETSLVFPFWDVDLPVEKRVEDLLARLTLDEKISQMIHESAAIPRLGVPEYNWWSECLHGVGRAGIATVFPQAIALAATWNPELMRRVAGIISDEARAKHHEFVRQQDRSEYKGLTFWSPNINIARDPRWGRTQETYGEDPYLTGRLAVAFVKGLQGNDPKYLKVVATPKHFAAHSGPESQRHRFDARVSAKDLHETYLPAFKAALIEGGAASIMAAYNRVNGEPSCASKTLLQDVLRNEWGFRGYVVSDVGAVNDFHANHQVTSSPEESAALAVRNGCDLNGGETFLSLGKAVQAGLILEEEIDVALSRLLEARFRLGLFDPPQEVPYSQIPYEMVDCQEHRQAAHEAAQESIVLLKNADGLLPLRKDTSSLAVIGPNADDLTILVGNYSGTPSRYSTLLQGIRAKVSPDTKIWYAQGCPVTSMPILGVTDPDKHGLSEAVSAAERSEVVLMVLGNTPALEGEEGEVADTVGCGDRSSLDLPTVQQQLLQCIHATGKPIVLVLTGGSPITAQWVAVNIPAILMAWYPGEEGGNAIADVLFGDYNPAGRLPMTFPKSISQLPAFDDYSMAGRTYRYMQEEPLYPFGYGLSYTQFKYSQLKLSHEKLLAGEHLTVSVNVQNIGGRSGDEVVQVYLRDEEASVRVPRCQLVGFRRVHLAPGHKTTVEIQIAPSQMAIVDKSGVCIMEKGVFTVVVGGCSPPMVKESALASGFALGHFELCEAPSQSKK